MAEGPTRYPEVNALLDRLQSEIRHVFRKRLVGLYLYGSLATGDYDAGISDLDLLAVTASVVSRSEFGGLRTMHQAIARETPEWDDRVEVIYLPVGALKTFRTEKSRIAVISPGEPFHFKDADRGYLMNWYNVRETGATLFGPPATSVIPLITREEFLQTVLEYVPWLAEWLKKARSRKAQSYAVLTMCRALHLHRSGEPAGKRRAALWAQEQHPEWAELIRNALEWRAAWRETGIDHAGSYDEAVRFVSFVREQIRVPSPQPPP